MAKNTSVSTSTATSTDSFVAYLRSLIEARGLTVGKVASRIGVTNLNAVFNGKIGLSVNNAILLGTAVGVDPIAILTQQTHAQVSEALAALDSEGQARLSFVRSLSENENVATEVVAEAA
jgi:plasmid maintenance system antidote protein VapI